MAILAGIVTACSNNPFNPTTDALRGTWRTSELALQPMGNYHHEYVFSGNGRYVHTVRTRGVYPEVPADRVVSYTTMSGTYTLEANILRVVEEESRGWDLKSGSWHYVGRPMFIEGPPTDPEIELTPTTLVMRFLVNPGNGYVPVRWVYQRVQ